MQITTLNTALSSTQDTTYQNAASRSVGNGDRLSLRLPQQDESDGAALRTQNAQSSVLSGTSETFSAEILRRLQSAQSASNAGSLVQSGAAGDLQAALTETIEYVRGQHGDAAATAVMGIIAQGVGDGSGGEDAFGNAMVSALKFVDKNFGIAAGDAAMAQFNGSLNSAINGYFKNGHNELFYASDGTSGSTSQIQDILSSTLSDVYERFGQETAETVADIMHQTLAQTGVNRQGLGKALAAADDYLRQNHDAKGDTLLVDQSGLDLNVAKGAVLDMTV